MHVVVWETVVHHGMFHWDVEEVMVIVVVTGPKQRERHWQRAWRWRHREQVCTQHRLPLPARHRLCRLLPVLRILQLPKVFL